MMKPREMIQKYGIRLSSFLDTHKNLIEILFIVFLFGLYLAVAPYRQFIDEDDVLLGGMLISTGKLPYLNWFSHHLPLPFFLSAVTYILGFKHVLGMRIVWSMGLFAINVVFYKVIQKKVPLLWARMASLFLAIMAFFYFGNMIIGETIISYGVVALFYLYFHKDSDALRPYVPFGLLIAFLMCFATLGFVPLSLFLGLLLGIEVLIHWRDLVKERVVVRRMIIAGCIIAGITGTIFLSGMYKEMYFGVIVFNSKYYSQFHYMIGNSYGEALVGIFTRAIQELQDLFRTPSLTQVFNITVVLGSLGFFWQLLQRSKWKAFAFVIAYLLVSSRGGIAYPLSQLLLLNPYAVFTGLATIWFAYEWWKEKQVFKKISSFTIMIFLWGSVFSYFLPIVSQYTHFKISNIYHTQSTRENFVHPSYWKADVINAHTTVNDYVFIGPGDFYAQLYLKQKYASYFRFYEPWHAACNECKERFFNDLETTKPKIIYWRSADVTVWWDKNATGWDKEMVSYLQNNYLPLSSSEPDFYIRKEQ